MSNEKLKSENYQNFGGMNSKTSPYVTGPMEFLNLINLDFQTPGSLSERWGSTMYVGQTFSAPLTMLQEYVKLNGNSYVIMGTSVGVWSGATTGQAQGLSFTNFGATQAGFGNVTYYNIRQNDFQYIGGNFANVVTGQITYQGYLDNSDFGHSLFTSGGAMQSVVWGASGNVTNGVVFNNYLFAADGNKFWKYDGVTTTTAQLFPPFTGQKNALTSSSSLFGGVLGVGCTGYYAFYASYVNQRGVEGPIWPIVTIAAGTIAGTTAQAISGGGTYLALTWKFTPPDSFGVSSVNIYSYFSGSTLSTTGATIWDLPYVFNSNWPANGTTFVSVALGTSIGGQMDMINNVGNPPANPAYIAMGISLMIGSTTGSGAGITSWSIGSYSPRYLEIYQNRLFLSGFSSTPSTVWFSDTTEPEGYLADSNFEVRTNDGDFVTCMKAYSTRLYIFKKHSFHVLMGDNPNNFFLSQITNQYGCLNNQSAIIYDDILVFLDQKGVIMWNGASVQVLSSKIQPLFDTMNYTVALNTACMVHDKLRNQVLIGIPTGSSTSNDTTVVYDYLVGAWTTYNGFTPSVFARIQGRNNTKNAFFGDTSGRVNWFGSSFLSDNSVGFTTYLKTRFLHDMGDSTQKMFRRLFLNSDSPANSTLIFGVNFFQDYGSTVVLGTTMVLSQFQNRIDYGVSAKSLAFEMSNLQTALPIRIHGFTIESRFLRRV